MAIQRPDNTLPLCAAVSHIFADISKSVSKEEFCESQSFLRSQLPDDKFNDVIEKLHEKIVNNLDERLNRELEGMMTKETLTDGLGKLKKLSIEHDSSQLLWRPPGDVLIHLRTIDANRICEQSEELIELVKDLENENFLLMKEIFKKRQMKYITNKKIMTAISSALQSLVKIEKSRDHTKSYTDILDEQYL